MLGKKIHNTVWKVFPAECARTVKLGHPVLSHEKVIFEHAPTVQYLSSDKIAYRNDFGGEFEVSCKGASVANKTQMLADEFNGTLVRENSHKNVGAQNHWQICTATDASQAEPVAFVPKYTGQEILADIKQKLLKRGSMAIRGLGIVFRALDDNRNPQVDMQELMWGLKDFDVHLDEEQAKSILNTFDRDGSGTVSFDELLRALRGDLSDARIHCIKQAYDKLDVNKDGLVKLDDIAKIYDVSKHPDVIARKLTPEEAYKQFMSLWDTKVADGIITFDEFCEYYRDVSASIDTDEYFAVMMKSAWKL